MGIKDLPIARGGDIVDCLIEDYGLTLVKRSDKNHYILSAPRARRWISIPDHKEVKRDLLLTELRVAGIDSREFGARFRRR